MLAQTGMFFLASGNELVTLFIGLETMAVSFYVLVGFLRRDQRSNEAALKYLLLGGFSSGFLVYGFSILYGISGSTMLRDIADAVSGRDPFDPLLFLAVATIWSACSSRSPPRRSTCGPPTPMKARPLPSPPI